MVKVCPSCGSYIPDGTGICFGCGQTLRGPPAPNPAPSNRAPVRTGWPSRVPVQGPQYGPMYEPPTMAMPGGPIMAQPFGGPFFQPNPPRALWAFILSMVAGILVILNAAALLSNTFYSMWVGVFFWIPVLDASPQHGLVFAIGAIIGLILVIGSNLMLLGYGTIGSIIVFPLAVVSLIIGGGFVAGFILGVLGGILGMLGK